MTLTDAIILLVVGIILFFIIFYEIKSNKGCHCAQMKRYNGLKKYYKKVK